MTLDDSGHDDALTFLRELVQAQSKGESIVQTKIADRLALIGCDIDSHDYDPASVPVIGEFASDESRSA